MNTDDISTDNLRLLCILAHPDDETLGFGGVLARYAAEGVETYVVTATRGEYGWAGDPADQPPPFKLGLIRDHELRHAAQVLGVQDVHFLDYIDGEFDRADATEVVPVLAAHIRRIKPHVVLTFGHDGFYGHPDHIAISQFATAAVIAAASPGYGLEGLEPHAVSKLYYRAPSPEYVATYERAFGELVMTIDGGERRSPGWADWLINAEIDATPHWRRVWRAVQCHKSQLPAYERLAALPDEHHAAMWGRQEFYRVFSLVNGGSERETDLFAGLREEIACDIAV